MSMLKTSKLLKIIGAACLSVGAISICMAAITHSVSRVKSETEASVGTYTTNVSSYYATSGTATGQTLLGQLHDLTCTNHKTYTSYDDCKNPTYIYAMEPGSTSSYIMEFYSQKDISKTWDGNTAGTWNREHVWPQSLSNSLWSESGGGADLQHLRPAEVRINGTRGNHLYAELTDFGISKNSSYNETSTYKYASNYYAYRKKRQNNSDVNDCVAGYVYTSSDVFEPFDNIKGDVARIVMYMYMHYNSYSYVGGTKDGSTSSYFGNLPITKVIKTSANTAAAAWALLLKWNENDPVSSAEQNRNNVAASYQGNRNPFIDYPDLAECIWGTTTKTWSWSTRTISGSSTTSSVDSVSVSPSALSLNTSGSNTTGQLTATVSVSGGAAQTVNWSSSNTSVATVSNTGLVTAVAAGSATITATSTVDSTKKDTCAVTVTSGGSGGGSSSGTLTITRDSFSTSGSYAWYDWSQTTSGNNSISGKGELYTTTKDSMQFNKGNGSKTAAVFNTTALPGPITKIEATSYKTTIRSWTAYVMSSACSLSGTTMSFGNNKTEVGTVSPAVGTSTSFGTSSSGYYYFCLQENVSNASYLSEIKITYGGSSTTTKTLSSISLNTTNVTTSFTVNDTFSYSGLVVTANYSDSTSATVTPNSVSSPDMTSAGNKTVTVSYTEGGVTKTANYSITVNESSGGTSNGWAVSSTAYKTAMFGTDYNSKSVQNYTSSWSSTYNSFTVNIENGNNNQTASGSSGTWTYIKFGSKNSDSTGTITTDAKIDKPIGKVSLTIDAITVGNITSIKLYTSTTSTFGSTAAGTFTKAEGTQSIDLETPTKNLFYKIEIVCTQSTSNGTITISEVDFYNASQTADAWGTSFLSTVTCNGGSTAPSTTNWATMKSAYDDLLPTEQTKVTSAVANESGSDLQKAIARYVFIVNKYTNRTNYPDYLSKASSSNRINPLSMNDSSTLLVVIATATCLIGMTFIALSIKKRKEK